jgi:hypothetical protein
VGTVPKTEGNKRMVTKRSALVLFLANIVMFYYATFVAKPWDTAAAGAGLLCGTAALLMYFAVRARDGRESR